MVGYLSFLYLARGLLNLMPSEANEKATWCVVNHSSLTPLDTRQTTDRRRHSPTTARWLDDKHTGLRRIIESWLFLSMFAVEVAGTSYCRLVSFKMKDYGMVAWTRERGTRGSCASWFQTGDRQGRHSILDTLTPDGR